MADPTSNSPVTSQTNQPFHHSPMRDDQVHDRLRRSKSQNSNNSEKKYDRQSTSAQSQSESIRNKTPVLDFKTGNRPLRIAYKLTYDPNREPGNEYQVEKQSVSEYDENRGDENRLDDVISNDNLTIGTDDVSLPVELDDKSTLYDGERVETVDNEDNTSLDANVNATDNIEQIGKTVTDLPPTPVDVIESRLQNSTLHSVEEWTPSLNLNHVNEFNEISLVNQETQSEPRIVEPQREQGKVEKDITLQSIETVRTNKSSPKPLTSTDRGETNILFKEINRSQSVSKKSSLKQTLAEDDLAEVEETVITRQADSIPPPNFKSNLFNRIKRISTPNRLAKLNRFLNRTSEQGKGVSVRSNKKSDTVVPGGSENVTTRPIVPETTFVKESLTMRFERMSSTDSIRTLYDKRRRARDILRHLQSKENYKLEIVNKENIRTSGNQIPRKVKTDNIRQIVSERKKLHVPSDVQKVQKLSKDNTVSSPKKRAIDTESTDTITDKPILAKRRLMGAKQSTRQGLFTDRNFGKNLDVRSPGTVRSSYIDSDDIFTEAEKKARLKKVQYMSDNLKLVKRKMKQAENGIRPKSMVIPGKNESAIKKSVLNNTNKHMPETDMDEKLAWDDNNDIKPAFVSRADLSRIQPMPKTATKFQTPLPLQHEINRSKKKNIGQSDSKSLNTQQGKQTSSNIYLNGANRTTSTKSVDIFNKVLNKTRKPSIKFKETTDDVSHSTVNKVLVHPKIHKMKTRREQIYNTTGSENVIVPNNSDTNSQTNVANWLMNSLENDVSRGIEKKEPVRNMSGNSKKRISKRWITRTGKPKLVIRLQKRKRKSSENTINSGAYMPLPKPSKRVVNRWNRLFTQVGKVKGYESEIPILYSDEEDAVYLEPRPLTDTGKNRFDYHRRYVGDQDNYRINYRDPAHRKIGHSTGALVKFFCNGESNDKGVPLTINKSFRNFEQLLIYLSDKIPTPTGVRHVFKWPEGQEIKSLTEFRNRCVYIVASTNKLQKIKYGESQEKFWSNKKPSAGKVRRDELGLFQKPSSPKESPQKDSPRIVTVINNRNREKKEKVILNPRTQQAFEDWLQDLNTPDMPVRALYTAKPPHVQVCSFSHLFRELKNQNNFIACGEEYIPLEISKKRQAPSSNSSTDSISESRSRKKKLPRQQEMGQIHENFENGRPMSTALSRYDYGPRFNPFPGRGPGRLIDSRRKDAVEIEVDGIIREFIPPSYFDPEDDGAKPDRILTPEWVYGFRGRDARQNILVLHETEEIVYYVAAVVVLYNKERDTQRHYIKHNEEITSMALHPDNVLIATGQLQGREPEHGAHIRIWNGVSLSDYAVIGLGIFSGGILSIGFSYDDVGTYLCALDMSEKHVLSVWDWRSEKVIARTSTTTDPVHYSCFYPDGSNTSILITFGIKHIYFWKIFFDAVRKKEAKILRDRNSGIFRSGSIKNTERVSINIREKNLEFISEDEIPESVNCIAWLGSGDIVTGDANGNMMLWERDNTDAFNCKMVIDAHSMPIMSLCLLEDGTLLSGAGTEIKAWDTGANFSLVKTRQIPDSAGHIRSIVTQRPGGSDGRLYIGTTNSAVLDGSLQLKFKYLVQGHGQGVYGVVPHQFEPTFISAGEDQVVFKWSLVTHKLIWRSQIEHPSTCVAVDHRRELVAIGTGKGVLIFLNGYNGMHIATMEVGSEPIGCLSFSRDCHLLAMGCNDGTITVFEMSDRNPIFKSSHVTHSCHKTGVAHLDWSTDSRCLQSTDYNHELIFWNVDTMQQIEITRLVRDVDWHTATCDMAYYMIGPWSNLERGEYIKACSRSNARDLILTGDTKGRLRLYKYPCSKEKADFRGVRVYSSGVTAIAFTPDNRSALTCGGNDAALIQWSLVDDVQFLNHI